MAAPTILVDVVSAEEQIYSGEAEFVVLPGVEGELGVYPRHTPLFTQIRPGAVRIKLPGDAPDEFVFVQGGFLEVQPTRVTVLADTAIRAHDLDEAKALEAMREAEEALKNEAPQATSPPRKPSSPRPRRRSRPSASSSTAPDARGSVSRAARGPPFSFLPHHGRRRRARQLAATREANMSLCAMW